MCHEAGQHTIKRRCHVDHHHSDRIGWLRAARRVPGASDGIVSMAWACRARSRPPS
jgi:hypothetical protein